MALLHSKSKHRLPAKNRKWHATDLDSSGTKGSAKDTISPLGCNTFVPRKIILMIIMMTMMMISAMIIITMMMMLMMMMILMMIIIMIVSILEESPS
jgi:hypothetical protein